MHSYNLSDTFEHCGSCFSSCDPTSIASCSLGVCECAAGFTDCGNSLV
jgi:hypothetical protein